MFDWRKLQVFLKVYESKSFSQAAKELFLSQPTVTIHIKELEEQLGVNLFERTTRNVVPTKAGHILYQYGVKLWQLWSGLEKELLSHKDPESGRVEVGASTIPGETILPQLIKEFKSLYPKFQVYLKVTDTQDVIEKVANGEFELGLVGAEIPHKNLVFISCCEDEIVLIASKHFEKTEISLAELPQIPLIAREPGSGTWRTALDRLKEKGIYPPELNIVAEMSSTSAVKSGVKVGIGLGFVSKRAIDLELALGLIKIVKIKDFEIKRQFYLVHLKKKRFNPPSEIFYNFLLESLSKRA